jgi:hypothetical protein
MALRGFLELELSSRLLFLLMAPCGWFCLRMLCGRDELPPKVLIAAVCAVVIALTALINRSNVSVAWLVVALEVAAVIALHLFVHRLERPELSIVLLSCFMLHYFLSRADHLHWQFVMTGPALLLPFLLFSRSGVGEAKVPMAVPHGTSVAILASIILYLLLTPAFRIGPGRVRHGVELIASTIQRPHLSDADRVLGPDEPEAAWASVYPVVDERKALRYVRESTSSDTPIFVGVDDHSLVFFNNLRLYWLADRPIGVRMFQLETRVATEPSVQREIAADLERSLVKWVILERKPHRGDDTFKKRPYQGSSYLDDYISSHYSEVAWFGQFAILRSNQDVQDVFHRAQ